MSQRVSMSRPLWYEIQIDRFVFLCSWEHSVRNVATPSNSVRLLNTDKPTQINLLLVFIDAPHILRHMSGQLSGQFIG